MRAAQDLTTDNAFSMSTSSQRTIVRVWDVPVRLVHWLIVTLIAVSWWTAENNELEYHRFSGYALLGLLAFRIYWGFAGTHTARFANFVRGPGAIVHYLRGAERTVGHNPLGALSVIVLLLLLAAQIGLGLFAVDVDGIESGPLSHLVSFDTGRECAELHEELFNVLIGFVVLHVAAVLFYLFVKRENLIGAMIHGRRELPGNAAVPQERFPVVRCIVGVILAGVVVWYITRG
jgi:cytochrome b